MKWQEAVNLSQVGVAERKHRAHIREPVSVKAWLSKRGRKQILVWSGAVRRGCGIDRRRLSVKIASAFEDWEPVNPFSGIECLAIAAAEAGKLRYHVDNRARKRDYRRKRRRRRKAASAAADVALKKNKIR